MQYLLKAMNKNQQNSLGILETSGNGRKRIHKFSFKIHSFIYFSSLPVKKKHKKQNKIKIKVRDRAVPVAFLVRFHRFRPDESIMYRELHLHFWFSVACTKGHEGYFHFFFLSFFLGFMHKI